ncbi:MAG: hypothetical protein O7E54_03210 [Planctomycetota bacterium]|nr:hypothetical protein [Planctomycetota bacterium]
MPIVANDLGSLHNAFMSLAARFREWVESEIGSDALPALKQHLKRRNYRLFSFVEHDGRWRRDVYHPDRGFFQAHGEDDTEALLRILSQIWLLESLSSVTETGDTRPE